MQAPRYPHLRCALVISTLLLPILVPATLPATPKFTNHGGFTAVTNMDPNTVFIVFNQPSTQQIGTPGNTRFDIHTNVHTVDGSAIKQSSTHNSNVTFPWLDGLMERLQPRARAVALRTWIVRNAIGVTAAMALGGYAYLAYQLYQLKSVVEAPHSWAQWRSDLSLEQLYTIPQTALAESLQEAIQQHYINTNNPTDFVQPLVRFMQDLTRLTQQTAQFIKLYGLLKKFRLAPLFPGSDATLVQAQRNHQRLAYLKGTFSVWAQQYKVDQQRLTDHL